MSPPKCGASNHQAGQTNVGGQVIYDTCQLVAGWGTDHKGYGHCRKHGGNTAAGKKYAQSLMAPDIVQTYGLPRDVDPHTALLEELHRTAGHVAWLQMQIRAMEAADLYSEVGAYEKSYPKVEPHIWLRLYQSERKHYKDVAASCILAGIEERRVKLAEEQGQMIAKVIMGVLGDLGQLSNPEVPAIVRKHLTLVEGGEAA